MGDLANMLNPVREIKLGEHTMKCRNISLFQAFECALNGLRLIYPDKSESELFDEAQDCFDKGVIPINSYASILYQGLKRDNKVDMDDIEALMLTVDPIEITRFITQIIGLPGPDDDVAAPKKGQKKRKKGK